jgi:polysaccharide biosynthesis transport protein
MDPLKVSPTQEPKLHFLDYWRIIRLRKTVILAVFLLVVITATLVTFILPESYSSTARIKIERDQSDIPSLDQLHTIGLSYDPYFIQTEFELIQSEVILGKVVDNLNLIQEWGKKYAGGERLKTQEAIALLKSKMDLRPVRNTSLIEIRVFSEKPEEAAKIANEIADVYRKHRQTHRQELSKEGIRVLKEELDAQEAKVRVAQTNVDNLRKELNISDAVASADAPSPLITAETLRNLERTRIESKTSLVLQETLMNRLKELKQDHGEEELAQVIPTAAPDPLLSSLLEQLAMAEQKLVTLEKEYGPEHVDVLKCKASVDDLHAKVKKRVNGIMEGIEAKVTALRKSMESFENEVGAAKTDDIQTAARSQPYYQAKRELEELQRLRQILFMKIANEQVDVALPKTIMVEIVDTAKPGMKPVRPNKPDRKSVV